MISEFLTEEYGRLKLNSQQHQENPSIAEEARVYLQPGKDRDGYWTSENLVEQVKTKAIPIFETVFPNCIALFAFDNSSNHAAYRSDALVASRMNLKPGGKQPKMRDTVFGPDNCHQSMVNEKNEPKGMKQVLIERGLWKDGLSADCNLCKDKVDDINRTDCCARRIVSLQPDFLSQKSALEEVILEAGHKCIFYPKFHCELNYIERYWGAAKRYARENCDYSWSGLQRVVPTALESVDTITIRRFARKAWRYMDLYRNGIT
ncbi:9157_t:CDS:1, partial [Paraglomus occultum]